ncbi:radical SAM protein [Colwellia psychrerythraea]|uniref:Radical SAM protein n=1 Tax=Colwellia psychrerythraea TaxID=28229 RepID=A0A1Y5E7H7_COLPS|nr:radical SAM protein [Colwellia psychrerythraea]
MYDVYCISAGQSDVKKEPNVINKKNMYLNYGLLGLASQINDENLSTIQLQGHFEEPEVFFEYCLNKGIANTRYPVFISMPSFYALSWLKVFTKLLKNKAKIKKIVLGGRWVIDGHPEKIKALLPDVDVIIDGLGDDKILSLLNREPLKYSTQVSSLNYKILDERKLYQPSLEVSRGCGMSCNFCQEGNEKLQPLKEPFVITSEVKSILLNDELINMTPYFESSMFVSNQQWLENLIAQREIYSQNYLWRTESRVDSISPKLIPYLAKAGLRVLDLGLESASHKQLTSMGKSKKPEKYLEKASSLINTAYEFGISVKINILLYAGETSQSIQETFNWLDKHRKFIKGVSIGPVIAFGWDDKKKNFMDELISNGASIYSGNQIIGVSHINLSSKIDHNKALDISRELSCEFMDAKSYYFLKSFSYFPRNYSWENFNSDVNNQPSNYSFSI